MIGYGKLSLQIFAAGIFYGKEGRKMTDRDYMSRAIALARKGEGRTNPNPIVGAVIVKNGRIIGKGYHAEYGGLHAERKAIASLTEPADGADMYVTLEPCAHYGKTPPCTEAILANGIARVVIGSRDPNPLVSGRGAKILREAGVAVEEDFMKEECDRLNGVFFHYITEGTPYAVMKYAMTADGRIATKTGASKWITGDAARQEVQRMRGRYTGIMAGIGTVLADDPLLNVRIEGLRNPVRIICDSRLRIPLASKICRTAGTYRTIIAHAADGNADITAGKMRQLADCGAELIKVPGKDGKVDLRELMKILGGRGIDSVLIEGGGTLNAAALEAGIVQEIKAFVAPKIFGGAGSRSPVEGEGVARPQDAVCLRIDGTEMFDGDLLISMQVRRKENCSQE